MSRPNHREKGKLEMRVNKEDEYTVVPIPAMRLIAMDVGFWGEGGSFLN